MSAATRLEVATRVLREHVPGLVAVYRFGSSGTAAERADSDLDLAVLTDPPLPRDQRVRLRWQTAEAVAASTGRDIDLVDLGTASDVLRAQVVAAGERIWSADDAAAERFEDYTLSAYARLNEERAGILQDIRQRGRIRG